MAGWASPPSGQAADSLLIYDAALRDFAATSERQGVEALGDCGLLVCFFLVCPVS